MKFGGNDRANRAFCAENSFIRATCAAVDAKRLNNGAENAAICADAEAVSADGGADDAENIAVRTENAALRTENKAVRTDDACGGIKLTAVWSDDKAMRADGAAVQTENADVNVFFATNGSEINSAGAAAAKMRSVVRIRAMDVRASDAARIVKTPVHKQVSLLN